MVGKELAGCRCCSLTKLREERKLEKDKQLNREYYFKNGVGVMNIKKVKEVKKEINLTRVHMSHFVVAKEDASACGDSVTHCLNVSSHISS